jgi:hypothetical protein
MSLLGLNKSPLYYKPPVGPGYQGEIREVKDKKLDGSEVITKYRFENGEWKRLTEDEAQQDTILSTTGKSLQPTANSTSASLRYPKKNGIAEDSHYVLFEFYEYQPPFRNNAVSGGVSSNVYDYNQATEYNKKPSDQFKTIALYMPEDISTGFKGNWGGKALSNIARDALSAAGGASLADKVSGVGRAAERAFNNLGVMTAAAATSKAISKITGQTLSNNDLFGAISGAILNPNAELLFDSVDMRNFSLNFLLVPRHKDEVDDINQIVQQFQMATLPTRDPGTVFGQSNASIKSSFIGVPSLCKVTFMVGGNVNSVLPKYKMCALTSIDISYTPDSVYAVYENDQPVAIRLSLSFQETKVCFAEEIKDGTVR